MALFSRGRKNRPADTDASAAPQAEADDPRGVEAVANDVDPELVPTVGISVTTHGASVVPGVPGAADPVPGLADNAPLRDALSCASRPPTPADVIGAARQLAQGQVLLRVKGDARAILSAGGELPLAIGQHGDESVLLVYSGGAAMRDAVVADGDLETSALSQPAPAVVRNALDGPYAGILLDHASEPAAVFVPRAVLEQLMAHADPAAGVKTALAGPRDAATGARVVAAIQVAGAWLAARRADDGQLGIAEVRDGEGTRRIEIFSHPLEVLAVGRGDQPVPVTAAQLGMILRGEPGITALIVDPAGPWIELSRADLAPLEALAPEPEAS